MTWLEIDLHELQHGSTFDYIEKKKIQDKVVACVVLEIKKKSNTCILVFSLMLDQNYFAMLRSAFLIEH